MADTEPMANSSAGPMRSLPDDAMPREKLARLGRGALTDEELLAIFLRTGLPGCNVLELAALLKKRAGSLAELGRMEASDIIDLLDKGIGPAKAATLAAVFELGKRAARESQQAAVLNSAKAVYDYFVDELRFARQEHMYVVLLNVHYRVIRQVEISLGTLTRMVVHPRDVFSDALRLSASGVLLVHNHPGGRPLPSSHDVQLTHELVRAGALLRIPVCDHVIIGAASADHELPYYSFKEANTLTPPEER